MTQELYAKFGITPFTELKHISAEQYPVFDDLGNLIDEKIEKETDGYNRGCLKVVTNLYSEIQKRRQIQQSLERADELCPA